MDSIIITCAVCGKLCERPERTNGGKRPKTCGERECIKQHKRNLKKTVNEKYRASGKMREWSHMREFKKDPAYEFKRAMRNEQAALIGEMRRFSPSKPVITTCRYCGIEIANPTAKRMYCGNRCMWRATNARPHRKSLRHRISCTISSRISQIVKASKSGTLPRRWVTKFCKQRLGYTWQELINHIESQFIPGMTWDNYGKRGYGWQIDHIMPLAIHGNDSDSIKSAYALSNLMPRWATTSIARRNGSNQIGNTNKGASIVLS